MEQRIREAQHETWRLREAAAGRNSGGGGGGPSDKSPFNKDGQYRHWRNDDLCDWTLILLLLLNIIIS